MKVNNIQSCHLGPEISPEQFISEHFFLYLLKGSIKAFDGHKHYQMVPGDYCIARKNHLVRYTKYKDKDEFEKIIITLDEPFLPRETGLKRNGSTKPIFKSASKNTDPVKSISKLALKTCLIFHLYLKNNSAGHRQK